MARLAVLVVACLMAAAPARADVRDYLGRLLADVRVELAGAPIADPTLLQLIETRIGDPLSMERVRETIDHLVGLGRFEDIRVIAEVSPARPEGVVLRWVLTPVQRIARVEFAGTPGLTPEELRAIVDDRFGSQPPASRAAEIVAVLDAFYRERGFRTPAIDVRFARDRAPELTTMVLEIDAGPRTQIGAATLAGDVIETPAAMRDRLRIDAGRPYDRLDLDKRLAVLENELRELGYYEASADAAVTYSEDGRTATLVVTIDRGPRVRVVFAGDELPAGRRDALVPVRQERSVDLDLLEDASRNIEAFLRGQGYRAARAPYTREQRGDELLLTFTVARGPMHRLASLTLDGHQAMPLEKLTPLLQLEAGEPFDDARVAAVAAAVTEVYRIDGFAQVSVRPDVEVLPESGDARPVVVRLLIDEGPRTMVRAVTLAGVDQLPESRVRALLTLTPGRPYYRPLLDADRAAIEQLYRDEGFQNVRVDAEIDLEPGGGALDVEWNVREGLQLVVDQVLVSGNHRTSADLIRREVVLQPGQPLGDSALVESQRRLAALGLFRRVRIVELPHGATPARDVLIEVEEAPPTAIAWGGGLEASRRLRTANGEPVERLELAPRGFLEVTRRNLWGKNRSISGFTRVSFRPRDPAIDAPDPGEGGYGFNEYRVWGAFREPRPFDSAGDLQITGFLEQAIRTSFNFSRRGVRVEYGRRVGTAITLSGRYAFDRTRLFDEKIRPEDRLLIDRLFPRVRLSTFTASILRDSRDDVLDPERGSVIGVDGTVAPRSAGSEVGFVKTFMQGFVYRRLPGAGGLIVAAGARVGLAIGFARLVERVDDTGAVVMNSSGEPIVDVVDDVPASERFFAGGDTTVRGFVLDRLGTDDTLNRQGFPTGGSGLLVMNLELRTPYWKGLGGVGFVDAGNVFRRAGDIALDELRPAAGFGVRYRSPLGPLRVDFGFNLNRRTLTSGERERGMVFHISLGQAF